MASIITEIFDQHEAANDDMDTTAIANAVRDLIAAKINEAKQVIEEPDRITIITTVISE